nr:DNA-processing protein DprA [Candidatus Rickettsia colombianensi]
MIIVKESYITVSGLARGIDSSVHQAAVSRTIGVIAGGIDHIYPPENKKLFENLAEEGLILAELPIGSTPLGKYFPQRNRITSLRSSGSRSKLKIRFINNCKICT